MSDQQLDCALDLMRRLPPQQIEKNLSDLIDLVPSLCEDLLSSVDQPLKIARDKVVGKDYLLCDYNRDGDSYRSPWSNKYDPPLEDGAMPSARLRKLEVEANNAFDQYRDLYFEGGVSSVYLWDLDHGFAGVILIKKAGDGSKKIKGCWDSIHVVEVQEKSSGRTAHYKLTSTVMLWLQTNKSGSGTMNLGGSLTRQMEKDETVSDCSPHIANIGRLVEDMENKIRSTLNEIYFGKTKDIVNGLRAPKYPPSRIAVQVFKGQVPFRGLRSRQVLVPPSSLLALWGTVTLTAAGALVPGVGLLSVPSLSVPCKESAQPLRLWALRDPPNQTPRHAGEGRWPF
uniref:F-actin-capping protein subunit beta n=1 Tax=Equus caballus TaxID=9796 RepID=A0A5F5PR53_HORSE